MNKTTPATLALLLFVLNAPAFADSPAAATQEGSNTPLTTGDLNELSGELMECSVYFAIAAEGVSQFTDAEQPGASKLAADYKQHAKVATTLSMQLGVKAGATPEALSVRNQNVINALKEIMHGSFANVSLLQQRYATFCKQLMENPASRKQEIQAGNLCNSEYRCWK